MSRFALMILLGLTAALAVAPSAAAAGHGDRASGFGTRAPRCDDGCSATVFSFDARSGALGRNSRGYVAIDFPGFYTSFTGVVNCLHVDGKWATLVGRISAGEGQADRYLYSPSGDPLFFVFVVYDGGRAQSGVPAPDLMSAVAWDTREGWIESAGIRVRDLCANPFVIPALSETHGLIGGDIRVVDR